MCADNRGMRAICTEHGVNDDTLKTRMNQVICDHRGRQERKRQAFERYRLKLNETSNQASRIVNENDDTQAVRRYEGPVIVLDDTVEDYDSFIEPS